MKKLLKKSIAQLFNWGWQRHSPHSPNQNGSGPNIQKRPKNPPKRLQRHAVMPLHWGVAVQRPPACRHVAVAYRFISSNTYLEPVCPLVWGFNPPKQGLFQSKQVSFGFQVRIILIFLRVPKKGRLPIIKTLGFFLGKNIWVHAVGETYSDKHLTNRCCFPRNVWYHCSIRPYKQASQRIRNQVVVSTPLKDCCLNRTVSFSHAMKTAWK